MKNVRNSQPFISMNFCTEFSKAEVFLESIVKETLCYFFFVTEKEVVDLRDNVDRDDVCNQKEIAAYMEADCHIFLKNLV